MIKQLVILFALVASVAAGGSVLAQTMTPTTTTTPRATATPTTSVPQGAPNTGFGTVR